MIKLFITDVDSTLTNGSYYMDNNGVVSKKFHTHDFFGLKQIYESGVITCAITGCIEPVTQHQFKRASDFTILKYGVENKVLESLRVMSILREKNNIHLSWNNVAFIGDDLNDLDLLKNVGWPACPSDAQPEILEYISHHDDGYVSQYRGGCGCVRDFINTILKTNRD